MIVDSSALVSIALNKDGSGILSMALSQSRSPRISAANLLETWTVIDRRGGPQALPILEDTMSRVGLAIEPLLFVGDDFVHTDLTFAVPR